MEKEIVGELRTYSNQCQTHSHHYAQLIVPLYGSLSLTTDEGRSSTDGHSVLFLPTECSHTYYSNTNNSFLVLDIPNYFCQQESVINQTLDDRWQALRFLLLNEIKSQTLDKERIIPLLRYALSLLGENLRPSSIKYLHENYDKKITIAQLADLEHYNLSYYSEWFNKQTGLTPTKYLQQIRLGKAKELLINTDFSLLQIAQQVGYEHQSSLSKAFQEQEKITPSQYRRKNRK